MTQTDYVALAYGLSALLIGGLIVWVLIDQQARRREIAELESGGVRRRSERGQKS